MNNPHSESNFENTQWDILKNKYALSTLQSTQLRHYLELLIEWNLKFNLTAITNPDAIMQYHFNDSLSLTHYVDFSAIHSIADIGTGAGFPGLALKILFPHIKTTLIEVNAKKRSFLTHVIQELELNEVIVYPFDWRTFLRTTHYAVDYFFARASLQPEELIRIFKPSSSYVHSILVYWASKQWSPEKIEAPFLKKEVSYRLGTVERKFVFFAQRM